MNAPVPIGAARAEVVLAEPAPAPDRRHLVDRADAAALLDAPGFGGPGEGFAATVQSWLAQWLEEAERRTARARHAAREIVQDAGVALARAAAALDVAVERLQRGRLHRDRLEGIVAGTHPGDDGGRWPATERASADPRTERLMDVLWYGGAAVAEVGLNYLAFQIMGSSALETAVLAAAIVLVNVALPKQIGELFARLRRASGHRGRLVAAIVGGTALWVGVSLFVALVRTAFLMLPSGSSLEFGTPVPLIEAGLGGNVLTWGWLAVVLAIGVVVLLRAAGRYNPYVRPLRAARSEVTVGEAGLVDARAAAHAARLDADRAWRAYAALSAEHESERRRLVALAEEVVSRYRAECERHAVSPAVAELPDRRG
ncbi:MAG: hypothetical protein ACT4RN_14060 [Pseudonocardia sp.]